MKKTLWKAVALMAVFAPAAALSRAREPLFIQGPGCPKGSARAARWVVFEDTNGDGVFDYYTSAGCNGDTHSGPWNSSVETDPWSPTGGTLIGSLPPGAVDLIPTMTYQEQPSGLFTWTLVEHASETAPEVCHVQRDAEMVLSMSCPPPDDGNFY